MYNNKLNLSYFSPYYIFPTVTDSDSMDCIVIQTRGRAFSTLGQAFDFVLRLSKYFKIFLKVCFSSHGVFRWLRIVTANFRALLMLIRKDLPQNGQAVVLKCSPIWKKMRKSLLCSSSSPKFGTGKLWLARPHLPSPRKGLLIENRDSNLTFILFYLNLTIWFSCLKTWMDVSWVSAYLWDFFLLQKREINDKGGICVRRDVT